MQNSKFKIKTFFIFLFIFSLPFTLYPLRFNQAHAQSVSLGIWPPILQLMIQPGKSITQVYKVDNQGDPVIVTSSIAPFVPSDTVGNINLVDCARLAVLGCESLTWINFQNADLKMGQSFFLGSDRLQEVVLKITIPEYASEGDYYNTLLFTTQAPPGLGDTKTRATATIGSNILITVSKDGNPNRTIEIVDFDARKKISLLGFTFKLPVFDSFDEIPVSIAAQNKGNAYTNTQGSVKLSGFPGLQSTYTIGPTNILAGTNRILFATPSAQLTTNSLTLNKGFYIGRYKLSLELSSNLEKTKRAEIYFFALPYKILSLGLLTLLIILIIKKGVLKKK